ncbi:T9SS C-terminal target domain-containing protein [bacterium]|nr:MAG: T9SS C-terminal target domain-containing protein [bacterium]
MKRIVFLILIIACCNFVYGQCVTIDGRQFKDENGNNFYPLVCNYLVNIVNTNPTDFRMTFISPYQFYDGELAYFECNELSTCNEQLQRHFIEMLSLGFNVVRIMGLCPRFVSQGTVIPCDYNHSCDWTSPATDFYAETLSSSLSDCHDFTRFRLTYDVSQILFEHILNVLTVASQTSLNGKKLKVILITASVSGNYDPTFTIHYNDFLNSLSQYIEAHSSLSIQETILAYDLLNEPTCSWESSSLWPWTVNGNSKQDICNNFKTWYNTIKSNEPHRLITLGGLGMSDVLEYDPEILNLDFYSPHVYPGKISEYEGNFCYNNMINRIKGQIFWLSNNLQMPWMIGETGFRANDRITNQNLLDGLEWDQKQYANVTLPLTYNCNGSGYSWWNYQDDGIGGPFWGVLSYGNCQPPCTTNYKQVHDVFEQFAPPPQPCPCTKPDKYYDPFYHEENSPNTNIVNGIVHDNTGNPIKDAYIQGWTVLKTDYTVQPPTHKYTATYTLTKEDGSFKLIPFDYDPSADNYNTIEYILISAPGCSRTSAGYLENHSGLSYINKTLQKENFDYSAFFSNITVPFLQSKTIQAWNDITLNNIIIENQAFCDIKARRDIQIDSDFYSEPSSETWIHLSETFFPCEKLNGFTVKNQNIVENIIEDATLNKNQIQLKFDPPSNDLIFNVYPNPSAGAFTVEISKATLSKFVKLEVFDLFTRILYSTNLENSVNVIDLSNLDEGMYYIHLRNPGHCETKKILIIK